MQVTFSGTPEEIDGLIREMHKDSLLRASDSLREMVDKIQNFSREQSVDLDDLALQTLNRQLEMYFKAKVTPHYPVVKFVTEGDEAKEIWIDGVRVLTRGITRGIIGFNYTRHREDTFKVTVQFIAKEIERVNE